MAVSIKNSQLQKADTNFWIGDTAVYLWKYLYIIILNSITSIQFFINVSYYYYYFVRIFSVWSVWCVAWNNHLTASSLINHSCNQSVPRPLINIWLCLSTEQNVQEQKGHNKIMPCLCVWTVCGCVFVCVIIVLSLPSLDIKANHISILPPFFK